MRMIESIVASLVRSLNDEDLIVLLESTAMTCNECALSDIKECDLHKVYRHMGITKLCQLS